MAGPTITFTGRISDEELVERAHAAKGFLFPNEEDFGISAAEAIAAGTPVIAYARGGALDIVQDGETGVLFPEQTVESLVAAIRRAETIKFRPSTLHRKSKRFAKSLFQTKMRRRRRKSQAVAYPISNTSSSGNLNSPSSSRF